MLNDPVYIEFEKNLAKGNFTVEQILNLSDAETKNIAGTERKLSENFISNMKNLASEQIQKKQDGITLNSIVSSINPTFPKVTAEIARKENSRIVILRLDGTEEFKYAF